MQRLHVRDPDADRLIRLLVEPAESRGLTLEDWDRVVRTGRSSRLLAALRLRLEEAGVMSGLPAPVRGQLDSEAAVARYRKHMVLRELHELAGALASVPGPVVLVKGAAYVVQGLRVADTRMVSDVDLMVPRARLDSIEARLREAGWQPVDVDPYDDRYYREWSHEVPPMRYPGHALELDLHHAILPPISRVKADAALLFEQARAVPGMRFRVLSPEDQLLHACVHTFVDSDLADRLRDIVDLDGLLREFAATPGFWDRLCARAAELGLGRGLWYGLRYASGLVSTPVPESAWDRLAPHAPGARVARLMDWLVVRATPPLPTDGPPPAAARLARWLASLRYFWIRMPLPILLRHAAVKGVRRILPKTAPAS
jgi:hypothetical protein